MDANLQAKLWRGAVGAVVYITNKSQLQVKIDKASYELWKGRISSVKHFIIFGGKKFMNIKDDSLGKFDSHVDKGIFFRYSLRRKAYKCCNNNLRNIVEIINVNIDEALPKK